MTQPSTDVPAPPRPLLLAVTHDFKPGYQPRTREFDRWDIDAGEPVPWQRRLTLLEAPRPDDSRCSICTRPAVDRRHNGTDDDSTRGRYLNESMAVSWRDRASTDWRARAYEAQPGFVYPA